MSINMSGTKDSIMRQAPGEKRESLLDEEMVSGPFFYRFCGIMGEMRGLFVIFKAT